MALHVNQLVGRLMLSLLYVNQLVGRLMLSLLFVNQLVGLSRIRRPCRLRRQQGARALSADSIQHLYGFSSSVSPTRRVRWRLSAGNAASISLSVA